MKALFTFLTLLLTSFAVAQTQSLTLTWQRTFGSTTEDVATAIAPTTDGGVIVTGFYNGEDGDVPPSKDESFDIWVTKFTKEGNISWKKFFGGTGNDFSYDIQQTSDGGYILCGNTLSDDDDFSDNHNRSPFYREAFIIKLDANGNVEWKKCYGGNRNDLFNGIREVADGYVAVGRSNSTTGDVPTGKTGSDDDWWIVKINKTGNIVWTKRFGSSGNDEANALCLIKNSTQIVVVGNAYANNGDFTGKGITAMRLKDDGEVVWKRSYGEKTAYSVAQTKDGGFIIGGDAGTNSNADGYVLKIFSWGTKAWNITLGDNNNDGCRGVIEAPDGNFVAIGYSFLSATNARIWTTVINKYGQKIYTKTFGGNNIDQVQSKIVETTDGGFAIAGYTESSDGDVTNHKGGSDAWILKFNEENTPPEDAPEIEWKKEIKASNTRSDKIYSIRQTPDKGYVWVGCTKNSPSDSWDFQIVKINRKGIPVWQHSFGGNSDDEAQNVRITPSGDIMVVGTTESNNIAGFKGGTSDAYLMKYKPDGTLLWKKTFGGSGEDMAMGVCPNPDGTCFVIGKSNSTDGDLSLYSANKGNADIWLFKIDANGTILWSKTFGGQGEDIGYDIEATPDGNYIIAASSSSTDGDAKVKPNRDSDYWLIKISPIGNIIWSKTFGGRNKEEAFSAHATKDGGYLIGGRSWSTNNDGEVTDNHGKWDFWTIKTDANGNLLWQKSYGGTEDDYGRDIQPTSDGGSIISGYTKSTNGDIRGNNGDFDTWVARLNANGKIMWRQCFGTPETEYSYKALQQTKDGGYIIGYNSYIGNEDRFYVNIVKLKGNEQDNAYIRYVKKDATGTGTGESWANAMTELSTALKYAKEYESEWTEDEPLQIWVAADTYTPQLKLAEKDSRGDATTDRDNTFLLVKNVKIYGGFAGTENAISQRDWFANKTILSGDVGIVNNQSDNVYHIITAIGDMGVTEVNGFTVKNANASGGMNVFTNGKSISREEGGGMLCIAASPRIENCIFTENEANNRGSGSAIYVSENGKPTIINSVFTNNKINANNSGALHLKEASAVIINSTFYGNTINEIYVYGFKSRLTISNSIIASEKVTLRTNSQINNSIIPKTTTLRNLFTEANANIDFKTLNIANLFKSTVATDADYLHLKEGAVAIDAGKDASFAGLTTETRDLAHNKRLSGRGIDMGAYEYVSNCNVLFPTVSVATATCLGLGTTATITNYDSSLSYTLSPTTASLTGNVIRNMAVGTQYVLIASVGTCSATSAKFQAKTDILFPKPIIRLSGGTCTDIGSRATISNYDSAYSYTISPTATIVGALISNLQSGTEYVVTAQQGSCSATSIKFKPLPQLLSPAVPLVSVTTPTGGIDGTTALITNYDRSVYYALSPATTSATLVDNYISGMVSGTQYVVTAKKGSCTISSTVFEVRVATGAIQRVRYVKKTATGDGTGESWNNAMNELADALRFAEAHKDLWTESEPLQIWVAADTYTPLYKLGKKDTYNSFTQSKDQTFLLPKNVKIYGGFKGDETNLNQRNWHAHKTILSGDIGTINNKSDNAYHIVTAIDDIGVSELNGFTITDGNAIKDPMSGSTDVIVGSYHIPRNKGAALLFYNASPRVENCIITQNETYDGGAIFNNGLTATPSTPVFVNVLVADNNAFQYASAMYNTNSRAKIINCTFYNNKVNSQNKELYNTGSTRLEICNTVILGESYSITNAIVKNSAVKGIAGGSNNNLDASLINATDAFVSLNTTSADYLLPKGILLNAGDKTLYPAIGTNSKDLAYNSRVSGGQIEIGAYEYQAICTLTAPIIGITSATCSAAAIASITNYSATLTYSISPSGSIKSNGVISATAGTTSYSISVSDGICTLTSVVFVINPVKPSPAAPIIVVASPTGGVDGSTAIITNYDPHLKYKLLPATTSAKLVENYISGMVKGISYSVVVEQRNNICTATSTTFEVKEATGAVQRIRYVKKTATGNGTGESWENAMTELADALRFAEAHKELWTNTEPLQIWVAADTYTPLYKAAEEDQLHGATTDRDKAFVMVKNVKIYGGFKGDEATLNQRNWHTHKTILSGEIGTTATDDNLYHIVIAAGEMGVAELNGFTLTKGGAIVEHDNFIGYIDPENIRVNSKDISRIKGGALHTYDASLRVENCKFIENEASAAAAIYNRGSNIALSQPVFINVIVAHNHTYEKKAGGVYNDHSQPVFINNTIYKNTATNNKFLIEMTNKNNASPKIYNTVIFEDIEGISVATFKNSLARGIEEGSNGNFDVSTINANNLFVSTVSSTADYLHPKGILIDAGDNTLYPNLTTNTLDLAHSTRLSGARIDIGAYEHLSLCSIATPTISVASATCSSAGSAYITNYSSTLTYVFNPNTASVNSSGIISATAGTYSLTVSNGTCSATSVRFTIEAIKTVPATPTISVASATCSSAGSANITNYSSTLTYVFSPNTASVNSSGVISATAGTYSLTASNGTCSATTVRFTIEAIKTVPVTPTISVVSATCSSAGTASITNYSSTLTYVFNPNTAFVNSSGVISATAGTYSLIVGNGSCSATAVTFVVEAKLANVVAPIISTTSATCSSAGTASITNYSSTLTYVFSPNTASINSSGVISATAGTYSLIVGNGSCSATTVRFTIEAIKTVPATPTISVVSATCSSAGSASITNYSSTLTYVFSPNTASINSSGVISATAGTYSLIVGNGSCSATAVTFVVEAKLANVVAPIISTTSATCSSAGTASITNYSSTLTYVFNPNTASVNGSGVISATAGTYSLIVGNGSCSATAVTFVVEAKLANVVAPIISTTSATCSSAGTASITNYSSTLTYVFSPNTASVNGSGVISATAGTYSLIVGNGSCSATAVTFVVEAKLDNVVAPIISTTSATCSSAGTASITNYSSTLTYVFNPNTASVNSSGVISATAGTYSLIVGNGSCSTTAVTFVVEAKLANVAAPIISTTPATCSNTGSARITNYDSNLTYVFSNSNLSVDNAGNIIGTTDDTSYSVKAKTSNGCESNEVSFSIANACVPEKRNCSLVVYNGLSANGDGINDIFYIENIDCYPDSSLSIFNRAGERLFEQEGYNNTNKAFKGYSNIGTPKLLSEGTYFYLLIYTDLHGKKVTKTGYLYISL